MVRKILIDSFLPVRLPLEFSFRVESRRRMKKIDLGETIGILANIGVIAGIVFLAVEIGQNNDQLAAQTRNTIYELRSGLERDLINNVGGIAELVTKERRGEALTDVEENRLLSRRFNMLRTFEYMVQENPDNARVQAGYMANMFKADPRLMETWQALTASRVLDPVFVAFAEEHVFPRLVQ